MKKITILAFLLLIITISSATSATFNITEILSKYPDFSSFNDFLSVTGLADQINSRQTITVLAVDDSGIDAVSGRPVDVVKRILSVHVILDYYDTAKLEKLSGKTTLLTTLFQSSGVAENKAGFLNVTDMDDELVSFGSAVPGAGIGANLVKEVFTKPYDLSILQVSDIIVPPGIENLQSSSPSNSPAAPPPKSATTTTTASPPTNARTATTSSPPTNARSATTSSPPTNAPPPKTATTSSSPPANAQPPKTGTTTTTTAAPTKSSSPVAAPTKSSSAPPPSKSSPAPTKTSPSPSKSAAAPTTATTTTTTSPTPSSGPTTAVTPSSNIAAAPTSEATSPSTVIAGGPTSVASSPGPATDNSGAGRLVAGASLAFAMTFFAGF